MSVYLSGAITGILPRHYVSRYPSIVYVEDMPAKQFIPPDKPVRMDWKSKESILRLLAVPVGTTVEFHNSDGFNHDICTPDRETYNSGKRGGGKGGSKHSKRFNSAYLNKTFSVGVEIGMATSVEIEL